MLTNNYALGLLAAASLCATAAQAGTRFTVEFNDPAALYASYYAEIERSTVAAGAAWAGSFVDSGFGSELTVRIGFEALATATGRSLGAAFLGQGADGLALYEQGAAHELKTGIDSNGAAPDIEIQLGINGYLQNELWFDPDPFGRQALVPADRVDAVSVLLHEFGHAFGFNGWRDGSSGLLPGGYQSTFDALVQPLPGAAGNGLAFSGPRASALYGGALPLTWGDYAHLGNGGSGPGQDLVPDLMNGVLFFRGTRYGISALDLAVMQDLGLPVAVATAVPEPASLALWLAGLGLLWTWAVRKAAPVARAA